MFLNKIYFENETKIKKNLFFLFWVNIHVPSTNIHDLYFVTFNQVWVLCFTNFCFPRIQPTMICCKRNKLGSFPTAIFTCHTVQHWKMNRWSLWSNNDIVEVQCKKIATISKWKTGIFKKQCSLTFAIWLFSLSHISGKVFWYGVIPPVDTFLPQIFRFQIQ